MQSDAVESQDRTPETRAVETMRAATEQMPAGCDDVLSLQTRLVVSTAATQTLSHELRNRDRMVVAEAGLVRREDAVAQGKGAFPTKVPMPSVQPTPSMVDAYPIARQDDSDSSDSGKGISSFMVRGDSYAQGLAHLDIADDEGPEAHAARLSGLMLAAARSYPPPPHQNGPIVMVCSYTEFSDLAHGPRGTQASRAMRTYRLDLVDGSLTLLSAMPEGALHNPAFCRRHPRLNVVYACTESVKQDGQVVALELDGANGALRELCPPVSAGGTSTCYLTSTPLPSKPRRLSCPPRPALSSPPPPPP